MSQIDWKREWVGEEERRLYVLVERTIISAVIQCLSNFKPFPVSSSFGYATPPVVLHSHHLWIYIYIFLSALSYLAHLYSGSARNMHTNSLSLTHFLMHMLNFRHTGGSLHNVWVWGVPCERGWRGGRRAVCSAPLACAKLVGWVTSRGGEKGGGGERSGRIEKLRRGGSSGELPIDMQITVGEINPRHYVLHLHSTHYTSLRTAVSNTPHREVMALWLHLCVP